MKKQTDEQRGCSSWSLFCCFSESQRRNRDLQVDFFIPAVGWALVCCCWDVLLAARTAVVLLAGRLVGGACCILVLILLLRSSSS
jgi:hypothetical protein